MAVKDGIRTLVAAALALGGGLALGQGDNGAGHALAAPAAADEQVGDALTVSCLVGYENHAEPAHCEALGADLGAQARAAHALWMGRNAAALTELKPLCAARIERAYAGDAAAIAAARGRALRLVEESLAESRATPARHEGHCQTYIRFFARPGLRVDIQREIIEATREIPARPVRWPD